MIISLKHKKTFTDSYRNNFSSENYFVEIGTSWKRFYQVSVKDNKLINKKSKLFEFGALAQKLLIFHLLQLSLTTFVSFISRPHQLLEQDKDRNFLFIFSLCKVLFWICVTHFFLASCNELPAISFHRALYCISEGRKNVNIRRDVLWLDIFSVCRLVNDPEYYYITILRTHTQASIWFNTTTTPGVKSSAEVP